MEIKYINNITKVTNESGVFWVQGVPTFTFQFDIIDSSSKIYVSDDTIHAMTDDEYSEVSQYAGSIVSTEEDLEFKVSKELSAYKALSSSDWKVLRHMREKTLSIPTSMIEDHYINFEEYRDSIAKEITLVDPFLL
jgi:hypothetical protein